MTKHLGPSAEKQAEAIRGAFAGSPLSESAIDALANVPNVGPHLPALVARGPATVEGLASALARISHWSAGGRESLVKLAASSEANAITLFSKINPHVDISGAEAWTKLVSRQLGNPEALLDYEMSLDKAVELRAFDPTVAIEVNYYKSQRVTNEELAEARADKSTFDKKQHKNLDVESRDARYEMKRVAPMIEELDQVVDQLTEGVNKFSSGKIPGLRSNLVNAKKNIVDVRFDDKLKDLGIDEAGVRTRVHRYVRQNFERMYKYVDEIAIHAEIGGKNVDMVIEVKL